MGKSNDVILISSGMLIVFACAIILILIVMVKRDYVRRYRVLATLFSLLGHTGILLVVIGILQSFDSYL